MWLREIRVKNLKRLRDFTLSLADEKGRPRMWTVLIGPNGTGKTSVLQAIALAAAGVADANELCTRERREEMLDKRLERPKRKRGRRAVNAVPDGPCVDIGADFAFGPHGRKDLNTLCQGFDSVEDFFDSFVESSDSGEFLRSRLRSRPTASVEGRAAYISPKAGSLRDEPPLVLDPTAPQSQGTPTTDPLVEARDDPKRSYWFVAAYGVHRDLPRTSLGVSRPPRASLARLRPLFDGGGLVGPNFASILDSPKVKRAYAVLLRDVLLKNKHLVPGLTNVELRGAGGVTRTEHLTESHRFEQSVGKSAPLMLPANWLSHGYRSSLAWLADLVGQIVLEANGRVEPQEMEGLVLLDEIDLYLHPTWQVGLVGALRDVLPNMQFIVTTHSPMLLSAFRRDEVVMLDFDDEGNVVQKETQRDPRLLTGSELYEWFFGIDRLYPTDLADTMERYLRFATDPFRSDLDDKKALALRKKLEDQKVTPPPMVRRNIVGDEEL